MSFYQKIYVSVTLLAVAITCIIMFICIPGPYSNKYFVEAAAIILSELIIGGTPVCISAKTDRAMLYSAGYGILSSLYFIFTVLMSVLVSCDVSLRLFAGVHAAGFLFFTIFMLLNSTTQYNAEGQDVVDDCVRHKHLDFRNAMVSVSVSAEAVFSGNTALLNVIRKLAEDVRYMTDPSEKTETQDREMSRIIGTMQSALSEKNADLFTEQMQQLQTILKIRETICK